MARHRLPAVSCFNLLLLIGIFGWLSAAQGAPRPAAAEPESRTGRIVTIQGVIDSALGKRVIDAANAAARDGDQVLIFDIQAAQSDFGPCYDLANHITRLGIPRTVAFVSKPLTGYAVLVALACSEIVLSEHAKLGDVGAGRADEGDITEITAFELIAGRAGHDPALVRGMLDRNLRLLEVTTPNGKRILAGKDLEAFGRNARILHQEVVKEAGERLLLTPELAKRLGLARRTAETRADVAAAYGLPASAAAQDSLYQETARPFLLKIEGQINSRMEQFIARRLQQARARGSSLLFVEIDSKSGDEESASRIANSLDMWPGRKVAWIGPPEVAHGPATLIVFGCDELVMARGSSVGDFHVDKDAAAFAASAVEWAQGSRFPPALIRGMIDPAVEVVEVVPVAGGAKTYKTAEELEQPGAKEAWRALRVVKRKGGPPPAFSGVEARGIDLASGNAESLDELKSLYDITGAVPALEPSWVDGLVDGLTSKTGTFFLIVLGMTCLYIEFHMPGFGVAGVLSVFCFVLFFWSRYLSNTANSLEIVMFLLGVLFLAVELFVLPGFGVTGMAGVLLMIASLLLASQSFTVPRSESETRELIQNMLTLSASMVVMVGIAFGLARVLPRIPLMSRMVLPPPNSLPAEELEFAESDPSPYADILGRRGTALNALRPTGRIELDGEYYDVVAQGSFIEAGSEVEVTAVSQNRIVVRRAGAA